MDVAGGKRAVGRTLLGLLALYVGGGCAAVPGPAATLPPELSVPSATPAPAPAPAQITDVPRLPSPTSEPAKELTVSSSTPTPVRLGIGPRTAVSPTVMPPSLSTDTPDEALSRRYFGQVSLSAVPAQGVSLVPSTEFFYQDQLGLFIEELTRHPRLPFVLRIFDADSSQFIVEAGSATDGETTATPGTSGGQVVTFQDKYVWYHAGGEKVGHYRAELYANATLTDVFDYSVGNLPVAFEEVRTTEPPAVSLTFPALPTAAAAPVVTPVIAQAANLAPTVVPTPLTDYTTASGSELVGLDVEQDIGRLLVVDASGAIWAGDASNGPIPKPMLVAHRVAPHLPVDLVADQTGLNLYVAVGSGVDGTCGSPSAPGCIVVVDSQSGDVHAVIPLPAVPGEMQIDSNLGLLYVDLPDRQAVVVLDVRRGQLLDGSRQPTNRTLRDLPQITAMAMDPIRHLLVVAQSTGRLSTIDAASGNVIARIQASEVGLVGVAAAHGLVSAIDIVAQQLVVVDPNTRAIDRFALTDEPAAIAAAEPSGADYVLSSVAHAVVRLNPADGAETGRVLIASPAGSSDAAPSEYLHARSRLVVNQSDETVYASVPTAGGVVVVAHDQFR